MGQTHVAPRTASGNHHHGDSETAIYVVSGHPVFVFAEDGEEVRLETVDPGDYVFVPPFTPHREENPDRRGRRRRHRPEQPGGDRRQPPRASPDQPTTAARVAADVSSHSPPSSRWTGAHAVTAGRRDHAPNGRAPAQRPPHGASGFPTREHAMGDKSPHDADTKKPAAKSIKEKRLEKKAKADHTVADGDRGPRQEALTTTPPLTPRPSTASIRCGPGSASARRSWSASSSAVVARRRRHAHALGQRDEVEARAAEVEQLPGPLAVAGRARPADSSCSRIA